MDTCQSSTQMEGRLYRFEFQGQDCHLAALRIFVKPRSNLGLALLLFEMGMISLKGVGQKSAKGLVYHRALNTQ